ncbi:MAG: hypothetical protein JWN78_1967, partial [Bacteroidota bacterium]|nr:hypothetical protein [Bacteroidota bacterium]
RYIHDERESINIGSNDVKKAGIYPILPSGLVFVDYQSDVTGCYFYFSTQVYLNGFLKVTRYDYQNGIIAGEFEIKLYDPSLSCDTFKIENGRFDYKLF